MELKTNGVTRLVLLTKNYAFKVPNVLNGWSMFLTGLLCNMQERLFSTTEWPELCPVVFSTWGGWLVVMRRARPLTDEEWETFDYARFSNRGEGIVPVELKRCSFGVLNDRIVAVDYG